MEVDEESKQQPATMLIDTTQEGMDKAVNDKKVEEKKLAAQNKRSSSLKLALILIGTMRVISK